MLNMLIYFTCDSKQKKPYNELYVVCLQGTLTLAGCLYGRDGRVICEQPMQVLVTNANSIRFCLTKITFGYQLYTKMHFIGLCC